MGTGAVSDVYRCGWCGAIRAGDWFGEAFICTRCQPWADVDPPARLVKLAATAPLGAATRAWIDEAMGHAYARADDGDGSWATTLREIWELPT